MTTSEEELDRMEAAILAGMADPEITARVPDWTTPDDLTRIGIDAMIASDPFGRAVFSRGNIRITGAGVTGHSAKANDVARIMTGFQRLATALGASHTGDKELGKQANAEVRRRTDLLLTAAPGPGSIVLTFAPVLSFMDEVGTPGMILELETNEQMLDTAVGAAIDVFSAGNEIGASPHDSAFVAKLGEMGPRTASAVRDLAKTLERAGFNIEVDWQQPARTTRRVRVTATAAGHMAATVEHANLDEQPVPLVGEYLTVSAVSSWLIRLDHGEAVTVKLGRIDPGQTRGLAVGDRVRIEAVMKIETTPGGNTKTTYTAQTFEKLNSSD
ncbi:hypothetical protein LK468_08895 [Mycobacteroides abscessus]|uniref:hypothetical protein n=1 Tax=Mycobacteroides abscessus TaxID=36809 RepID=UPI000929FBF8|nr:hypothetical protein [Mycobacteroides abscessus]UEA49302.1 hypothetical protein LK451_03705 [Mycobacteroides abscessus subsp. abscessus]UEA54892.1 hypothetical protein LK468_08895 [Mycobacteroides abscessus]SHR17738.1 Uncharacterised protein [Mycobacteroides abscessus subsp. bolletii]SHS70093.1 Uncharacterised protein [Mycobacteroides abscessus subsp. bolletii]SHS90538.1 Uncharacterised protein [Mycobacteroides abscessus subsp. bolletii]